MNSQVIKKCKNIQQQSGVSMVEALVSLLIFTVGALGLAALQLSSLAASSDSEQRSLAVWKAQEFADRIKSNPGLEGNYVTAIGNADLTTLGVDSQDGVFACPTAPTTNCVGASCSDAEIVAYDVWEVFCQANTGVLNVTTTSGATIAGSSGFNQLEIILRQLPEDNDGDGTDDGTGDMELYFEWVSQEGERTEGLASSTIQTNLCAANVDVNVRLDAYCMRFR